MNTLHQLLTFLAPSKVHCSENDPAGVFGMDGQEEYLSATPKKDMKVPQFEHLMNSVMMVTGNLEFIKGFKCDVSVPFSEYFLTQHSWYFPSPVKDQKAFNPMMPQNTKSSYTLTTQVIRDVKGQEPGTVMVGKVDTEGKLDAFFIKKLLSNLTLRITGNFMSSNTGALGAELEYEDKNSTAVFRWMENMYSMNFMQRIHHNLIMGFDYTNVYGQKQQFFSYAAKYKHRNHRIYGMYMGMQDQLNLAYWIPLKRDRKKEISFISHYRYDNREKKSTTILGLKQKLQTTEITATVNSRFKLTTQFTIKMEAFGLKLCALIDYPKDNYNFGYGIFIGQQG